MTKKRTQGLILRNFLTTPSNEIVYQERELLNPYVDSTNLNARVSNALSVTKMSNIEC